MKVRYILLLVLLGLIISSVFYFTECKQEKPKVTSFLVELINDEHTMKNNTICFPFGDKVDIDADDFKVTEIYSDGTTKLISQKSGNNDGYNFESTIPNEEITPAGNYTLIFTHTKLNKSFEIKIIVNKISFNMSNVIWDYNSPFTYDGTEKEVKITNLPVGVSVTYVGNKATDAGSYTATAIFTHNDANYEIIPNKTLTWEVYPTEFKVEGTAKLKEEYNNLIYKGDDYTIELDLTELDSRNIEATIDSSTITAKDVGVYYAIVDLKYIGTNANYNRLNKNFLSVEWRIQKSTLLVEAKPHSIEYGEDGSNNGAIYTGFVGTDTEIDLDGVLEFDCTYKKGDNVGAYLLIPKGLSSKNYDITFIPGNLSVETSKIDFKNVDWLRDISYTYSGNEIKPVLNFDSTEIVKIAYSYVKVGCGNSNPIDVGTYKAIAEITLVNNNYEIINNAIQDYEYVIIPKTISVSGLVWSEEDLTYNGNPIKPIIVNSLEYVNILGYNYTTDAIAIEPINVGIYIAKAILSVENNNYKLDKDFVELNYMICAKSINCSLLEWQEQNEYNYDGICKTPKLKNIVDGIDVVYSYQIVGGEGVSEPIDANEYIAVANISVVSDNYKIVGNVDNFKFKINPQKLDCSVATWQADKEYIIGGNYTKPILINLPAEVLSNYQYLKDNVVVEEFIEAGNYVAVATMNPINRNYVIDKYPSSLEFNFIVKEGSIDNPEVEYENIGVKLVVDGVEYIIYKDDSCKNLEYDSGRSVYTGKISADYLFDEADKVVVENLYVFEGKSIEDLWNYREIELIDGYAEGFWLKLTIESENPSIGLVVMGYGVIILTCAE